MTSFLRRSYIFSPPGIFPASSEQQKWQESADPLLHRRFRLCRHGRAAHSGRSHRKVDRLGGVTSLGEQHDVTGVEIRTYR